MVAQKLIALDAIGTPNEWAGQFSYGGDAARAILRGLTLDGARVVARARSPHGSDCSCYCPTGDDLQLKRRYQHPIAHCRCIRVMRVHTSQSGDWLLIFGDMAEGGQIKLMGPYRETAQLSYGGGFWIKALV